MNYHRIIGFLVLSLLGVYAAIFLTSCAGMGQVTYSGQFKGLPVMVVVGK